MKLLLVSVHIEDSPRAVPLGPAMLASALKADIQSELNVDVLNFYLNQSPSQCAKTILSRSPDAIGLSIYIWNREFCIQLAELIRQSIPEIVIFAGGPEVSAGTESMQSYSCIDALLPGEGEEIVTEAMKHLIKGGDPADLTSIITPAPVADLSTLPSPFLDGTLNPSDYSGILWELSRGCPFKCDFCYESRGTSSLRRFPIRRIEEELKLFSESGVEQIFVLDPTFNYNKQSAKEVLELIEVHAPQIMFFFEARSEFIDEEMASLFASIECSLQIGMQSASNDVLKKINRTINQKDFTAKILLLHQAEVSYGFDLIYGLPGDTLKGFSASLDFALSLAPNHVDVFPLSVLPGTKLFDTAPSLGLIHEESAPYQVISSPKFSASDMLKAKALADAFDLFYNRGAAIPWFDTISDILNMPPSRFFRLFADWMSGKDDNDITSLQTEFVTYIYAQNQLSMFTSLAADIINYFGRCETLEELISVDFNHNPVQLLELLDQGITDIRELKSILPEYRCSLIIEGETSQLISR